MKRRIDALMTARQIEQIYGIKPGTLRKWVERGQLPRPHLITSRCALYDPVVVRARLQDRKAA